MARSKEETGSPRLIDLQVQVNTRGRSVANGTVLVNGQPQPFHRELMPEDVSSLLQYVVDNWLMLVR